MTRAIGIAALGFLPASAWANAGIGFLLPAAPALLLALLPVILIEAPVFAALLRLPFLIGLKLAASINGLSTLLGFLFAFVIDIGLSILMGGATGPIPGRGPLLGALVPMFFFTLWVEDSAAARKHPELPRKRVAWATLAANVLSYAALWATILYTPAFHSYDQRGYRDHISIAVGPAVRWQEGVEQYWRANNRFPQRAEDLAGASREARRGLGSIVLEPEGRIVLVLSFPDAPEIDGKRVVYEPRVDGDGLRWTCRAPELAPRYLPYGCKGEDGKK